MTVLYGSRGRGGDSFLIELGYFGCFIPSRSVYKNEWVLSFVRLDGIRNLAEVGMKEILNRIVNVNCYKCK